MNVDPDEQEALRMRIEVIEDDIQARFECQALGWFRHGFSRVGITVTSASSGALRKQSCSND